MYLAGKVYNREGIQLFSASLPEGVPLAATGWPFTRDPSNPAKLAILASQEVSHA